MKSHLFKRAKIKICRMCEIRLNVSNSYYPKDCKLLCKEHYFLYCSAPKRKLSRRNSRLKYEAWHNKTPERRKQLKEIAKRMHEKYPEKNRARSLTRYAVKAGKLAKTPCEVCNNIKSEAHHEDYTKPLEVRWLCRKHHMDIHYKEKSANKEH